MLHQFNPSILRLLRVFNAVAKYRGFTAAETVLNVGQPTISTHIKELEGILGFEVCERGRSGFRLTDAGQRLYESTQRLERDLAAFIAAANDIRDDLQGSVTIGIPHVLSRIPTLTGLHQAIGKLRREFPSIQIEIHLDTQREIETGVIDGRYDLAISGTHLKAKNIEVTPLFGMTLRLYCAQGHPLFAVPDSQISADLLLEHSAVIHMFDVSRQLPYDVTNSLVTESSEVSIFYILSGAFVGYLSEYVAEEWVGKGQLRAIRPDVYSYDAPGGLVVQNLSVMSPAVRKVVEVLVELNDQRAGWSGGSQTAM